MFQWKIPLCKNRHFFFSFFNLTALNVSYPQGTRHTAIAVKSLFNSASSNSNCWVQSILYEMPYMAPHRSHTKGQKYIILVDCVVSENPWFYTCPFCVDNTNLWTFAVLRHRVSCGRVVSARDNLHWASYLSTKTDISSHLTPR